MLHGSGGRCGGGAAGAEVKQHTDPQRGTAARGVSWTHNLYRETPLWATTTTKEAHSPHVTPHHTVGHRAVSNKWFTWIHLIGSHTHNDTVGHTITQPVNFTRDDPMLDTHITRTQSESYIPLAGLSHTTVGRHILWLHKKVTQQSKKVTQPNYTSSPPSQRTLSNGYHTATIQLCSTLATQ